MVKGGKERELTGFPIISNAQIHIAHPIIFRMADTQIMIVYPLHLKQ